MFLFEIKTKVMCALLLTVCMVTAEQVRTGASFQRFTETLTDLVYITMDNFPVSISQFSMCSWLKTESKQTWIDNNVGAGRLFSISMSSVVDPMDVYFQPATDNIALGLMGPTSANPNSDIYVTTSIIPPMNYWEEWQHMCFTWAAEDTKGTAVVAIMKSDGSYIYSESSEVRKTALDNTDGSGSFLMFHEQDSGAPIGALEASQSFRGEASNVEIYLNAISMEDMVIIGCGIELADIQLESYNYSRVGNLPTVQIQQEFCTPEKSPKKWIKYDEPTAVSGTSFIAHENIDVVSVLNGTEEISRIARTIHCFNACVDKEGCHSVVYKKADSVCKLITENLFDLTDGLPFETSDGATFYSSHYIPSVA